MSSTNSESNDVHGDSLNVKCIHYNRDRPTQKGVATKRIFIVGVYGDTEAEQNFVISFVLFSFDYFILCLFDFFMDIHIMDVLQRIFFESRIL